MKIPTYAKSAKYYAVPGYFPGAASVAVTAYDLADGSSVSLSSSAMTQIGTTGRWYWSTSNFTSQPADGKDILIIMTPNDGGEAWDELLNFGAEMDKIYDIATAVAAAATSAEISALDGVVDAIGVLVAALPDSAVIQAACEAATTAQGIAKTADVQMVVKVGGTGGGA